MANGRGGPDRVHLNGVLITFRIIGFLSKLNYCDQVPNRAKKESLQKKARRQKCRKQNCLPGWLESNNEFPEIMWLFINKGGSGNVPVTSKVTSVTTDKREGRGREGKRE